MGLPLFIAPVETDLPHKASGKDRDRGVIGPTRNAIRRRQQIGAALERRRRTATATRRFGHSQPNLPPAHVQERGHSMFEPGLAAEPAAVAEPDPQEVRELQSVLVSWAEEFGISSNQVEDRLRLMEAGVWDEVRPFTVQQDHGQREIDVPWSIRARHQHGIPPRVTRRINRNRNHATIVTPLFEGRVYPSRIPHPNDPPQSLRSTIAATTTTTEGESRATTASARRGRVNRQRSAALQSLITRRNRPLRVDGLGDRNRSLSPEVWDTLLTTLTPDPQPPSAGSSFASALAPPAAEPPTNVPPSASDVMDEANMDHACESGGENSDVDENDLVTEYYQRIFRNRADVRQDDPRVPDYNMDGLSEGPLSRSSGLQSLHAEPQDTNIAQTIANLRAQADNWVGRLWAGPSEEEAGTDHARQNREDSTGTGHSTHAGYEDLHGMQRIVRSLAAREDIPDEWWAGAGLSRTLPQEDAN